MKFKLTPEQEQWAQRHGFKIGYDVKTKTGSGNPLLELFGKGPEGEICKHCKNFYRIKPGANTYRKCALRVETRGPGSDHKATWPACGKFETVKEPCA